MSPKSVLSSKCLSKGQSVLINLCFLCIVLQVGNHLMARINFPPFLANHCL